MIEEILTRLYENYTSEKPIECTLLPASGSDRKYYRIKSERHHFLGVFNVDEKENRAFISYTKHFTKHGLNVPDICFECADDKRVYLIKDLGDTTLYARLCELRKGEEFPKEILPYYEKAIRALVRFQVEAGKDLDYSVAYPRAAFDRRSMLWDLNYFKYYFLKLSGVQFDEELLENDFQKFMDFLLEAPSDYFLYRDFQSRNIMIFQDDVYFIDYQGGRKGALQYDLASLLYDAKADLTNDVRQYLLQIYIQELKKYLQFDEEKFVGYFYGFVFIRIMQAMGSYGFRGYYERKEHFLKSIPYALNNLEYLLKNKRLPLSLPAIENAFSQLLNNEGLRTITPANTQLTVTVCSFSYKKGWPQDSSENGGGFVFDCRGLPNPGRDEAYKTQTGKDLPVIQYLEKQPAVKVFIDDAFRVVSPTIKNYIERGFTHLFIAFGCTGGQHRSVYSAEQMAKKIKETFGVNVVVKHREWD